MYAGFPLEERNWVREKGDCRVKHTDFPFSFGALYVKLNLSQFVLRSICVDNITLIGMPGSGKSTVGVLLAKALGYNFLDLDLLIQQREGMLLQDILDEHGVERFLDKEAETICSVECSRTVLAPGGSAVCREDGMVHLKGLGPVVYLRVPMDELNRRIKNLSSRGIAMNPGESLADVMAFRAPLYEKYADLTVDVLPEQELGYTMLEVLRCLRER